MRTQRDYLDEQDWARPQYGTGNSSDRGSWPEPGERVTLLSVFREGCEEWYKHGRITACTCARRAVLMALVGRHNKDGRGSERVARWWHCIKAVLDRVETEAKTEVGQ